MVLLQQMPLQGATWMSIGTIKIACGHSLCGRGGGEILTAHKRSCRKVMFLQMCVYSQGEVVYCRGWVLTPWIHGILQDTGNKWVMRILLECFLVGENFGHDLPTFRTGWIGHTECQMISKSLRWYFFNYQEIPAHCSTAWSWCF